MRRVFSFLLAFTLTVCLCAGLTGGALAVEKDISATVGSSVSLEIDLGMTEKPTGVDLVEGQLPPGLSLDVQNGKLMLTGTPTQEGAYQARIHVDPADDSEEHTLRIRAAAQGGAVTTAAPAADPTATPAGTAEATPETTPETTPESTEAPATETPAAGPWINKHPGGETISEHGTAIFVSRADGAAEIEWVLVAPNGIAYGPEDAENLYSGLIVTGQGTETLTLYGVPAEMNGWAAECHFKNAQGAESISGQATVTVNANMLPSPVISRGPEETFLLFGQSTTMAVYATPAEGCTILYQWYQTTTNDSATATPIEGATAAEYTPPETDGTVYYCVGLRNVNDQSVSTTAYTPLVAITYGSEPPVPDHVHDFGTTWYNDDVYHWQQCECGEIGNKATHSYSWTETIKPTSRKQGERHGVCTVCGYETTQPLAAQKGDNSGRPRMTTVIALLMIAVALLLFGVYYYTRTSGGRNPAPRRSAPNTGRRAAPQRSAPRQTRSRSTSPRRQPRQDQWQDQSRWQNGQDQWQDQDQWQNDQGQWQDQGQWDNQGQWQDGQGQWDDQGQWQDNQGQWDDDQGQWR